MGFGNMARWTAGRIMKIAMMAIAALALFSFIVMWLWNWLAPPIFGWHTINFWQALGLLVLSKILFGGIRGGHGGHGRWSRQMRRRWEQMTPQEREKLRKGFMECSCWAHSEKSAGSSSSPAGPAEVAQH